VENFCGLKINECSTLLFFFFENFQIFSSFSPIITKIWQICHPKKITTSILCPSAHPLPIYEESLVWSSNWVGWTMASFPWLPASNKAHLKKKHSSTQIRLIGQGLGLIAHSLKHYYFLNDMNSFMSNLLRSSQPLQLLRLTN
jgi:hypothetical protein